jgi:DNA-binding transcriptional MerR regulator
VTDLTQGSGGRTDGSEPLTIDELAAQVGMTVRNVRAHQSRGLLPPPDIQGRTGYYGPEHVARLELVKDLQAEGFNLEAIKRIVQRTPGSSSAAVLDFTRALAQPFTDEPPEIVDAEHFTERWGKQASQEALRRAQRLGFVQPLGDGSFEIMSPRLERASNELAQLGVPLDVTLELTETVKRHADAVAKAYVRLFLDHVWRPFQEAGEPEERWPEVREALERLRPLAGESLIAIFGVVMTAAVERALERELARMGREQPPTRRRRRGKRQS